MHTIDIHDAQIRFLQIVDWAAAGEDVVVSRHGVPLVRITRLEPPKRLVRFGVLRAAFTVPDDFDAPLPEAVTGASGRR
jgi:prevent-host-death family protein